MPVDLDAKLTERAAEILRDAVKLYDQGPEPIPVLEAWNTGMLTGLDATGSFLATTSTLPALTQSLPALTQSLPALTGSLRALGTGVAVEPRVSLKRVFRLPDKLPGIWLPPEPELAAMARSAPVIGGLADLAVWLGREGRLVTRTGNLTDSDAADVGRQLRIGPEQLSSLWQYGLFSGWFKLEDSEDRRQTWAMIEQTAWRMADSDDSSQLHGWAAVFAAVAARALRSMAQADPPRARELHFKGPGVALVVTLFAARQSGMTAPDIEALVRDRVIGENPSFSRRRAWNTWVQEHGHPAHRLLGELAAVGAVTLPQHGTGTVELTPLALWALRKQLMLDSIRVPVLRQPSERMTAADLVAVCEAVSEADFDAAFTEWMRGRDPEQAARELLIYAGSVDPQGRLDAIGIARRIGAPAYRAWKDAVKRPELRGYARVSLSMMAGDLPKSTLPLVLEPDPDDMAWMVTDLLATVSGPYDDPDPAEIGTLFAQVVPDGRYRRVLGRMAQISHPDNARVLDVLGTYHPDGRVAREARKAIRAMVSNMTRNRGRPGPASPVQASPGPASPVQASKA
jgi:hypothetical protein